MLHIVITTHAVIAIVCWLIAAAGATYAVFSRTVQDTVTERIGLAAIAMSAIGAAHHIVAAGMVSDNGFFVALALAIYVLAQAWGRFANRVRTNPQPIEHN